MSGGPTDARVSGLLEEAARRADAGRVCVRVVLHPGEVAVLSPPPPLYLSLPRGGYLAAIVEAADRHFAPYRGGIVGSSGVRKGDASSTAGPPPAPAAAAGDAPRGAVASALGGAGSAGGGETAGSLWFETPEGNPLKWQFPVGVLYDLMAPEACLRDGAPWRLVARSSVRPASLPPLGSDGEARVAYLNSLKQSVAIRTGTAAAAMALSAEEQRALFRRIQAGDAEAVQAAGGALATLTATRGAATWRAVPVRLVRAAGPPLQRSVSHTRPDGTATTVRDALNFVLHGTTLPGEGSAVLVNGVEVDGREEVMEMAARDMCSALSHPDGFLYFVSRSKEVGAGA